jgi:hypothetical protein
MCIPSIFHEKVGQKEGQNKENPSTFSFLATRKNAAALKIGLEKSAWALRSVASAAI